MRTSAHVSGSADTIQRSLGDVHRSVEKPGHTENCILSSMCFISLKRIFCPCRAATESGRRRQVVHAQRQDSSKRQPKDPQQFRDYDEIRSRLHEEASSSGFVSGLINSLSSSAFGRTTRFGIAQGIMLCYAPMHDCYHQTGLHSRVVDAQRGDRRCRPRIPLAA